MIDHKRPGQQPLPRQGEVPLVVHRRALEGQAVDFDLRSGEETLGATGVLLTSRLGPLQGPLPEGAVKAAQRLPARFADVPQPFAHGGLVWELGNPQKRLERAILIEAFGIRQRHAPAGKTVEQLSDIDQRREAVALMGAGIERALATDAFLEAELFEQGGDGQLTAVDASLPPIAKLDRELPGFERVILRDVLQTPKHLFCSPAG